MLYVKINPGKENIYLQIGSHKGTKGNYREWLPLVPKRYALPHGTDEQAEQIYQFFLRTGETAGQARNLAEYEKAKLDERMSEFWKTELRSFVHDNARRTLETLETLAQECEMSDDDIATLQKAKEVQRRLEETI